MLIKMTKWEGVTLSKARVEEMIRSAVHNLADSDSHISYILSGDTMVVATDYDDVVEVTVAKVTSRGTEYLPEEDSDIIII